MTPLPTMTILARTLTALLTLVVALAAQAGPLVDATKTCLADSTTGKDRKVLARWVFVSMAAHPEIRSLAQVTSTDGEQSSKAVGELFTHLIVESCAEQVRAMVKGEGPDSMRTAFEFLGGLAMQELTANPEVRTSISGFERFVDRARVAAVLDAR